MPAATAVAVALWATHRTCDGKGITRASRREAATLRSGKRKIGRHRRPLQLSASDARARASNRGGRSIDGRRKNRTRVRNNQSPARRIRRREPVERKTQDAAVVAVRNCNSARERGKAQSYLCRRSSAAQFQTRMRTLPMP